MSRFIMLNINGIDIFREGGHLLLVRDDVKMRCDHGELNHAIEEFEEYYSRRQLQKA